MISDRKASGVFVKTPVLVQDTYSVEEIAILFRVSRNSVYEWHKREDDPLPLRRMNGKKRGFFAYRDEGAPTPQTSNPASAATAPDAPQNDFGNPPQTPTA